MKHFVHDNPETYTIHNDGFFQLDKCAVCQKLITGTTVYAHDSCWNALTRKSKDKIRHKFDLLFTEQNLGKPIEFTLEEE